MSDYRIQSMTIDTLAGQTIDKAVEWAVELAKEKGCRVEFEFNGTAITVDGMSNIRQTLDAWWELGNARAKVQGASIQPPGNVKWGSWR